MRRTIFNITMYITRRLRQTSTFHIFILILVVPSSLLLLISFASPTISFPSYNLFLQQLPPTSAISTFKLNTNQQIHHLVPPTPSITLRNVHGIPTRTLRWLSPPKRPRCRINNNSTDLRLIVLTMNRGRSLLRLLDSLNHAEYENDECIVLDIWVDFGKGNEYYKVLNIARNYKWKFGIKNVHERIKRAGLYEQWIYTWEGIEQNDGKDVKETALILEDDLEISPQYWRWLKQVKKRYGMKSHHIGAYTLQRASLRPRQMKGKFSGNLKVSKDYPVYLYLLLGTWGFSPKPQVWIKFRRWFEDMKAKGKKPYVPHLLPTAWYKSQERKNGIAPNMWSMWWIKFADVHTVFTLYANMKDKKTLAANWKEKGLHYSKGKPIRDFDIYNDTSLNIDWPENLIRLDWAGRKF